MTGPAPQLLKVLKERVLTRGCSSGNKLEGQAVMVTGDKF